MKHGPSMKSLKFLTTFALVPLIAACGHTPNDHALYNTQVGANRSVEGALADRGDLSLFYQALHTTGVANELNDNRGYAIFAPTNAAFTQIQPNAYPCFYAAQCRAEVAAVLRNHIVPRNKSISDFSKWGSDPIPTIGNRGLHVDEAYKDEYSVDGYSVLYQSRGEKVSVYPIDGVIISDQELAQFRRMPVANTTGTVFEKTVTTYPSAVYHDPYPLISDKYSIPGGYVVAPDYGRESGELPESTSQTTTVTRTVTTP